MSSFLRRATAAPSALRAFSTSAPRRFARVTVVGNLGDTPELVPTSTGRVMLRYNVATTSGPVSNRHTSWFRIVQFLNESDEKRRDFMLSLPKGSTVVVEADVSTGTYQDAEGKTKQTYNFVQRTVDVIRRPHSQATQHSEEAAAAPAA